jgi:hypothetical protein
MGEQHEVENGPVIESGGGRVDVGERPVRCRVRPTRAPRPPESSVAAVSTRRQIAVGVLVVAVLTAWSSLPTQAVASGGPSACVVGKDCYASLAEAVAAADHGDTVRLSPGTFAGGVTIDHTLRLVGAGPGRTKIRGGGPVLTLTSTEAERTEVLISGLTVTGGVAHGDGVEARGGGIFVPPAGFSGQQPTAGASLTLREVVVTGNRTEPTSTSPSPSGVKCPESDCPYAGSYGGGIATFGDLTLHRSVVMDNVAGGIASDAAGGGVWSVLGDLRLHQSSVSGNKAEPLDIGRYAEGGGIFVNSGSLTVTRSHIDHNRADLVTSWPVTAQGERIDMNAHGGGIHAGETDTVVRHSTINHNVVRAIDPIGEPLPFDSGMLVHLGHLTMRDSQVNHNKIIGDVATTDDIAPVGSALEVNAASTISDSEIVGNSVRIHSDNGSAIGTSGLAVYDFTETGTPGEVILNDVNVSGNTTVATSDTGSASVVGAGIFNNSLLRIRASEIRWNRGSAFAPQAQAQGGGIWNGVFLSGPPVELSLVRSAVTGNGLRVSLGGVAQGGGIFNSETVMLDHSLVARNRPDQCYGC